MRLWIYQNVINSVPFLPAKFHHFLPVGLVVLFFTDPKQLQDFIGNVSLWAEVYDKWLSLFRTLTT